MWAVYGVVHGLGVSILFFTLANETAIFKE